MHFLLLADWWRRHRHFFLRPSSVHAIFPFPLLSLSFPLPLLVPSAKKSAGAVIAFHFILTSPPPFLFSFFFFFCFSAILFAAKHNLCDISYISEIAYCAGFRAAQITAGVCRAVGVFVETFLLWNWWSREQAKGEKRGGTGRTMFGMARGIIIMSVPATESKQTRHG